jgi:hypothetical protein
MGSKIECFWLEPIELGASTLRRYEKCDSYGSCPQNRMRIHDTTVAIGEVPYPFGKERYTGYGADDVPHDHPQWPKVCETCGYVFKDTDVWQHNVHRLFKGAPDGKLYSTRNMPPGAMYDAFWSVKGPDGIALAVVLPPDGGYDVWHPDANSSNGTPWTRTGTVPKVTCSPSVQTPRYHGHLRDGFLVEC